MLAGHRPPGAVLATLSGALVASVGLLLLSAPLAAYGAFVMLGLAGGFYATANGALWAAAYGTERPRAAEGVAASAQIAGAAAGPLPLALSLSATDRYRPGLILLSLLTVAGLIAGWRWSADDPR